MDMTGLPKELASYAEAVRIRWGIPGFSASLIDGRGQGFGSSSNGLISTDFVMNIASNTKLFTAVALGILVDEGKLSWTIRLKDVLPGFSLMNKHTEAFVTIEDMLAHLTGTTGTNILYGYTFSSTPQDILNIVQQDRCQNELRAKMSYDNRMYTIAGHLITVVTGQTFADFVTKRILKPLGMHSSGFKAKEFLDRIPIPAVILEDGKTSKDIPIYQQDIKENSSWDPPAGLFCTSSDLAIWLKFLQSTYQGQKQDSERASILSQKTLKEIVRPRTLADGQLNFYGKAGETAYPEMSVGMYGLGVQTLQIHGINVACHLGGVAGWASVTLWTPDRDFGIAIVVNTTHRGNSASCLVALRAFEDHFALPHVDWEGRTWARDEAWKTAPTALPKVLSEKGTSVDSVDIERIKGVYKSSAYPLLHLIHSNTPLESVPQGLHEFWALKERSSLFGKARTPPENQTLAVWEAETVFERFATVIPLGGNAFLAEWSYVFRLEDRSRAMIFPASAIFGFKGTLMFYFEEAGRKYIELKSSWEDNLPKVDLYKGDLTFEQSA